MELMISGYGQKPKPTISRCVRMTDGHLQPNWQDSIENPSFLCQGDGYIFTVTEAKEYACVYCYQRTSSGFELEDERRIEGGALCHITYSSKNHALFGACYGTGTLFGIQVENGRFGTLFHYEIQGTPITRAHCVLLNHQEDKLYTINIALDCIFLYAVTQGKLILERVIPTPKGCGPRHALLSADEALLYVITEYSNEILVYENGHEFKLLQRISTVSESCTGISNCSTLCFSKNRQYLYAANRGADTITLFTVKKDGLLERITEYNCGGKHPRHMIVTKDGMQLIICNQHSDLVTSYSIDLVSGEVLGKETEYSFPEPSGVLELLI